MFEDETGNAAFRIALEAALLDDLQSTSVQGVNSQIDLAMRDVSGELLAGLAGTTSYGWLKVNMLWVSTGLRRTGLGRKLMQKAIDLSLARECHAVWLETSSPKARAFYEKLGFTVFATLANGANSDPSAHTRWFLRSTLKHSSQIAERS